MNIYMKTFLKTLIIVIIFLITSVFWLNNKVLPYVLNYTNVQTKKVAIELLKNAGLKEVNKKMRDYNNSVKIIKNSKGEIESIDFDTVFINEILLTVSKSIRKKLKAIEKGKGLPSEMYGSRNEKLQKGIIYEVPILAASKNVFLSNLGPKVPVKISYSGNVGLDIKTRIKEYGINSALIEIYIYVEVTQRTITPFASDDILLTSEIPVIIKVVKGTVSNSIIDKNKNE